jgi:hypothetical protein
MLPKCARIGIVHAVAIEALQNLAQSAAVLTRTEQEFEASPPEIPEENEDLLVGTTNLAPRLGEEQACEIPGNNANSENSAAESGAFSIDRAKVREDLAQLIAAWPRLPEPARQAVMALIRLSE